MTRMASSLIAALIRVDILILPISSLFRYRSYVCRTHVLSRKN